MHGEYSQASGGAGMIIRAAIDRLTGIAWLGRDVDREDSIYPEA